MVTFCATLPAVQDAVPARAIVELPMMVAIVVTFTAIVGATAVPATVIEVSPAVTPVTVPCWVAQVAVPL